MRELEDCSCGAVGVTKATSVTGHSYCLNPSCKRSREAKESQWQPGGQRWQQHFARRIQREDPQLEQWQVQQVVLESMQQAARQQVDAAQHGASPQPKVEQPEFPPSPPNLHGMIYQAVGQEIRRWLQLQPRQAQIKAEQMTQT